MVSTGRVTTRGRFFLSCVGSETKLEKGDELVLLGDESPSNFLFLRGGGYAMAIRSDKGELPITGSRKVFTRDEACLLAIGLATGSGLSLEEEEKENGAFKGKKDYVFRFV